MKVNQGFADKQTNKHFLDHSKNPFTCVQVINVDVGCYFSSIADHTEAACSSSVKVQKMSKEEALLNVNAAHFRQKSIYLNPINSIWTVSR